MLIDQKETQKIVRQIVLRVTANQALHDDLAQEAIIHLWLRESECPGQKKSWYYQSCRFHLQNLMRTGRSVDSNQHRTGLRPLTEVADRADASVDESIAGNSVRGLVSARETSELLAHWLTDGEREILSLLEQGYSARELAVQLGRSHTSVIRTRKRIAALASKLGILRPDTFKNGHLPKVNPQPPHP